MSIVDRSGRPAIVGWALGMVVLALVGLLPAGFVGASTDEDPDLLVAREVRPWDVADFGLSSPVGIAHDPARGEFLVASPASGGPTITRINSRWERIGEASVAQFDSARSEPALPDAIDAIDLSVVHPTDGLLYTLEADEARLYAYDLDGQLQARYETSGVALASPRGMTFAPSSDPTDDPGHHNLFVADAGTEAVMEVTLEQVQPLSSHVVEVPTLIRSVSTHQWTPPSTDPTGIAWNPNTGRLMVVDSEVNETSQWAGVNMWHISRTGSVQATGTTDDGTGKYSDEPTGLGFDALGNALFVSDDTGTRAVYVVKPGRDGRFGTSDDRVTQLDLGAAPIGAFDMEDPAYDPVSGHLFVLGGVDREIYRLAPVDGDFSKGFVFEGSIDLSHLGATDFEGMTLSASKKTLFVGAKTTGEIFEITHSGTLLRVIETDIPALRFISGLGVAPSSIDGSKLSMWIADRGQDEVNDGRLFEIGVSDLGDTKFNLAPRVDAGPDRAVVFPSLASLSGTVSDDGLPTGVLNVSWRKVSGPGTVRFSDSASPTTTVRFSAAGRYSLRLTASDGVLSASDTVRVNVLEPLADPGDDHFIDDDGHVFEGDINAIASAGITRGCNPPVNDRFCPDDTVTRGQMAAFLVRALNLTDDGGGDLFTDDDDSVFQGDIDRLAAADVTRGCNPPVNDRFCPHDRLTRGQMAAFLVRALGYTDDGGGDLFEDDDDSVFEGDIDRLATAGVTRGCNPPANDRFCPNDPLTRGQMAAFLARALLYGG